MKKQKFNINYRSDGKLKYVIVSVNKELSEITRIL